MFNTPNMGLTVWDQKKDDFSYVDLENNFLALDNHDHSLGNGVQIDTEGLADGAVTQNILAPASVGHSQIISGAVETDSIAPNAITAGLLAPGAGGSPALDTAAVTATKLDPTVLPLGSTIMWWRPPGSQATPGGFWEAMDGRAWNSISNAWHLTTGHIPDTRNVFMRGSDINGSVGPAIGGTGGSASVDLTHAHGVNAHQHGLDQHNHPIPNDGAHGHTFMNGRAIWSRANTVNPNLFGLLDSNGNFAGLNFFSLYIKNLTTIAPFNGDSTDASSPMDASGIHNHTGFSGFGGPILTQLGGATTDNRLGSESIIPPYLGLLMIMRVR